MPKNHMMLANFFFNCVKFSVFMLFLIVTLLLGFVSFPD